MVMVQSIQRMVSGIPVYTYAADSLDTLAWDIARRLCTDRGKVVVVCERPALFLLLVKQQWKQVVSERQTTRILRFSLDASPEALETLEADVVFATVEQLLQCAPDCQVLYVTCPIKKEQFHMVTAWMPKGSRVVCYGVTSATTVPLTTEA